MSAASAPLRDPPGPTPAEAAPTPEQAENPLALLMVLGERYGELVRVPSPYGQSYLYNHPSFVRPFFHSHNYERTKLLKIALGDGTLSSDGAVWREQRRIVQPAFQPDKVRGFGALMVDEARAAADPNHESNSSSASARPNLCTLARSWRTTWAALSSR